MNFSAAQVETWRWYTRKSAASRLVAISQDFTWHSLLWF
jgi:hypothetical protein